MAEVLSRCLPPPALRATSPVRRGRQGGGERRGGCGRSRGQVSEKSFPASAQFSFLTSVRMICTASGVQPSARQVASVSSWASLRRCSGVRPSNIWTLIIGMGVVSSLAYLGHSLGYVHAALLQFGLQRAENGANDLDAHLLAELRG